MVGSRVVGSSRLRKQGWGSVVFDWKYTDGNGKVRVETGRRQQINKPRRTRQQEEGDRKKEANGRWGVTWG